MTGAPTAVPFGAFSATGPRDWSAITGASFTFVRLIVTVPLSDRFGEPLSVACTVRLKLGVVSKSSAAGVRTVTWPVAESIAKALPVFPAVIE